MCVEMNPSYHQGIKAKRGCSLIPTCVLDREVQVGVSSKGHSSTVVKPSEGAWTRTCTTLRKVFAEHHIEKVDLMSIDIEGREADVLRCLDLRSLNVRLILIEVNKYAVETVDAFFHSQGYASVASFPGLDKIYERLPSAPMYPPHAACDPESSEYRAKWSCKEFNYKVPYPWLCPTNGGGHG